MRWFPQNFSFAAFQVSTLPTVFPTYYPPQRGLNENSNGLIRQYFPKGMDLTNITDEQVQLAVERQSTVSSSGMDSQYFTPQKQKGHPEE